MKRRNKTILAGIFLLGLVYAVTYIFAKDVFEILVPFWQFPRDCGASCGGG